jgi:hypothetical protein
LEKTQKISFSKAVKMIKTTEGYKTNLHRGKTFSPGWLKPDKKTRRVMFRYYKGREGFAWSGWYEIQGKK